MTNINCSSKCLYQKDGKCTFDNISSKLITANANCAYFVSSKTVTKN